MNYDCFLQSEKLLLVSDIIAPLKLDPTKYEDYYYVLHNIPY